MSRHLAASLVLLTACGSSEPCPATPESHAPTAQSHVTESSGAAAPCNDAPPAKDVVDPDVMALANAAKSCPFERGSFDWNCAGFKAFARENDDLFEGGSANATLMAMLEDEDIRMRALVKERGFSAGRVFFADKKHAERLLAVVEKERDEHLLYSYGRFVAMIDPEKTQLTDKIETFAKHPSTELRRAFASTLLPQHPNAYALGLTKKLIDDPDNAVRRAAIGALSGGGRTRPSAEICATLSGQLGRSDKLAEDALEAGSSSKCEGMKGQVIAEIEKRAQDPKKLGAEDAIDVRSTLTSLCWGWGTTEDVKKRAFDVAKKLAPVQENTWRRRSYVDTFRICDVKRAKEALVPFTKDKDKEVANNAKEELKRVEEELKRQK